MHTHGHFLHVLYFLETHLKWLPILHTLMRVLSCIVCCHAKLPHHLLSPINALWTQQWHIVALPMAHCCTAMAAHPPHPLPLVLLPLVLLLLLLG
jgi:hypothetical protein